MTCFSSAVAVVGHVFELYVDFIFTFGIDFRRVKTVSSSCVTSPGNQLLLGTESGHVFIVELKSFRLLDKVIYQESVIQT